MATENLKVKITADANQAKAEIGKFKNSLKGAVSEGEAATKAIGKVTVALGGMMVALKGVKAAVKSAIDVAAAGDAIKDNAQKVFMGTTAYQEWGYVLKQNGISMQALKGSMRKFSQEVASGSDKLAKYGITATDVDTAFEQAVGTIQNMGSETEKIAAATELFGNRALELMPVLNLTNAETQNLMESYRMLGGTMSNELIAASDTCTDSITALKAAWGGLRNILAAYVIPIITKVVQWLTVAIGYVRIFLKALFGIKETFGGKSGSSKKSIAGASASTAKSTGGTANNLKKAAKHAKELRRTLMSIDELSRLAEKASSGSGGSSGGGGGGNVSVPSVGGGDVGSIGEVLTDEQLNKLKEFQGLIDNIQPVLNGIYTIMKGLVEITFGNPIQGLTDIWNGLKNIFPDLQKVEDGFDKIKSWVAEKKEALISINFPTWDDLKAKWEELKGKFADFKTNLGIDFPTWDSLKKKWEDLTKNFKTGASVSITLPKWKGKGGLKSKWDALKAKFTGKNVKIGLTFSAAAQNLKTWINNNVFSKINKVFAKVPILKNYKLKLAKGGVLTAPTEALLGEYPGARSNPEIATPQSLMYETMQRANGDLVGALATMTRQVIAAIEDKDLSVNIGDEQIARSAQRGNTAYKNRTGKPLLTTT